MRLLPVVLMLALSLAACGEDDLTENDPGSETGGTGGGEGQGGTGGTVAEIGPVEWAPCDTGGGECATVDVPLNWEAPDGETLPFFVRRFPTSKPESKGQLWLLQGGPGAAGWMFYEMLPWFTRMAPDYDVYVPDYRGVGRSAWLGCEGQSGATVRPSCASSLLEKWGADKLAHFNTTEAARDLGHVIEAIRKPDEKVLMYSTSYGTFLANRYLTLFPDQPDGVVLDSVCPATGCDVRMDRNYDAVVGHVFDLCGADEFCASKLGPDPKGRMLALLDSLKAGHCTEFFGTQNVEAVMAMLAMTSTMPSIVSLAPAVAYRAERCSPEDVDALEKLLSAIFGGGMAFAPDAPMPSGEESAYLSDHVIFSEFWPEGVDVEAAKAEEAELSITIGALVGRAEERERWTWPFYENPAELMQWANTSAPVLLLNGDLDAQTHLDGLAEVEAHFTAPGQHFVRMPLSGHGTIFWSGPATQDPRMPCGWEIIDGFFDDPRGTLDTSCAENTPAADFMGDSSLANGAFGTDDLWENEAPAAAKRALPSPMSERQLRALEELHERARTMRKFF